MKPVRQCKNCPAETQAVCRYAFGVYWCIKSGDGKGCNLPMDDVAEAWRKAGWTPTSGKSVPITIPLDAKLQQTHLQLTPPLSDDDY